MPSILVPTGTLQPTGTRGPTALPRNSVPPFFFSFHFSLVARFSQIFVSNQAVPEGERLFNDWGILIQLQNLH